MDRCMTGWLRRCRPKRCGMTNQKNQRESRQARIQPPARRCSPCISCSGAAPDQASAGTGKTWTIAALYLRLVLGPRTALPGR